MPLAESPSPITAVFVYGTLKRGECRAKFWPHQPIAVESATIRGRLYDLGPYPALGPGDDTIRGEAWRLAAEHMLETLRILDEVEGATQLGSAYYRRIIVTCNTDDGASLQAFAYEFADLSRLRAAQIISPNQHRECSWPT